MSNFTSHYIRFIFTSMRILCSIIILIAVLMFLAAGADCTMHLQWGWDCSSIYILPLVMLGAGVVYGGSILMQRFLEKIILR